MSEKKNEGIIIAEQLRPIEKLAVEGPKVKVTENQLKVMANKYLRGDSVELWLRRIARNIALAELLYDNGITKDEILKGVSHKIINLENDEKNKIILLQDHKN